MPRSVSPQSRARARTRLSRNTYRRRLGGVCAGLADYLQVNVSLIRFLFAASVLFGGLGMALYLALWVALPAHEPTNISGISWRLRGRLWTLRRKVRRVYQRHDNALADRAQELLDLVLQLAPDLEAGSRHPSASLLREQALQRFPDLLDRVITAPPNHFAEPRSAWADAWLAQLDLVQTALVQGVQEQAERLSEDHPSGRNVPQSEVVAEWRRRLRPLRAQLPGRAGPEVIDRFDRIEQQLMFLLERLQQTPQPLDLHPYEVNKIAFEYLPDALNEYLRLPAERAQTQRLNHEKTADQALAEQLGLLDDTLQHFTESLFAHDATGLLVHGRFLKEKFADQAGRFHPDTDTLPPV